MDKACFVAFPQGVAGVGLQAIRTGTPDPVTR
jgi:hypothetical protein